MKIGDKVKVINKGSAFCGHKARITEIVIDKVFPITIEFFRPEEAGAEVLYVSEKELEVINA